MRSLRLALAAVALAGVAAPLAAHAAPPQPPASCHLEKYVVAWWTEDVPVVGGQPVYAYRFVCYY